MTDEHPEEAGSGGWPAASTRLVALLGWPGRYSRSPQIHNAAFRHVRLDLVYVALPCKPDDLSAVVATLRAVDAAGANVTVPYKQDVIALTDRLTDEARTVGAVNTLVFAKDGIVGDNTDADGLADDWRERISADVMACGVTVLGTGGGARAAVLAAGRMGADVTVVGRRQEAAEAVAHDLAPHVNSRVEGCALDAAIVPTRIADSGLVVNATPLGMKGEQLPSRFMALQPHQVAYDLVYEPEATPFMLAAVEAGACAYGGLGMLVRQAARAFTAWSGQSAPVEIMERAALGLPANPSEGDAGPDAGRGRW
ncbi:MAG: shikimate dehydrogenase [Nitriliruptoraceae bacterium]